MNPDVQRLLASWLFADLKLLAVNSSLDTGYTRNRTDYSTHLGGPPLRTDLCLPPHTLTTYAHVRPVWKLAFAKWKQSELARATDDFQHHTVDLVIRIFSRVAYPAQGFPWSSTLELVLSLDSRELLALLFVR